MPTSVLLAVLAAAGLLALAPALVRRYDATERLVAERAESTARVLDRTRRRRTVPIARRVPPTVAAPSSADGVRTTADVGRAVWLPVPEARVAASSPTTTPSPMASRDRGTQAVRAAAVSGGRGPARRSSTRSSGSRLIGGRSVATRRQSARKRPGRPRQSQAVYRRRRVLALLLVLNVVEVIGVVTVSPGFWTGLSVTLLLLGAYVVHLRNAAIADVRVRKMEARKAAMIAAEQRAIRESHARRIAARREALRRAAAARATAQRESQRISQRYVDHDSRRSARVRGRAYEQGAGHDERAAGF